MELGRISALRVCLLAEQRDAVSTQVDAMPIANPRLSAASERQTVNCWRHSFNVGHSTGLRNPQLRTTSPALNRRADNNGMAASPPFVAGADKVIEWFGHWPSFHDAEILSVHINRSGPSSIRIFAFNATDRVDDQRRYVREREATIVFEFSGIRVLHLDGEDADGQNVIAGLSLETVEDGHRLYLAPCYGLAGEIVAETVTMRLEGR